MRSFDRTKNLKSLSGLVRPHMRYVPEKPVPIVVPKMTLAQMIAAGNYDMVDADIARKEFQVNASLFTTQGTKVFSFNRCVSTEKAVALMAADGYKSARIETLLAYSQENPDEQREYAIVALGSRFTCRGSAGSPVIDGSDLIRELSLYHRNGDWNSRYRFLGVRKPSK